MHKILIAGIMISLSSSATATKIQVGPPNGKWIVYSRVDGMTDEKSCVAEYDGNNVQLTLHSFAVGFAGRGGIDFFNIRIDNDPPMGTMYPDATEKSMGFFILENPKTISRIMNAKRIRVQTVTLVNGIVNDDIDLTQLEEVKSLLHGVDCG